MAPLHPDGAAAPSARNDSSVPLYDMDEIIANLTDTDEDEGHSPPRRTRSSARVPLYDLDEIIANLTDTDEDEGHSAPRRTPRRRPAHTPRNNLDEAIANLTLEDEGHSLPRPRTPQTPPPPYEAELPATPRQPPQASAASTPPATPRRPPQASAASTPPATPRRPPQASSSSSAASTLYTYTSPRASGTSRHWSEAANATQGSPNSRVRALRKSKVRKPPAVAYAVFRGRTIGVMSSWSDVEAATSGVRFALQQGYSRQEDAEAVFEFADNNGWTCRGTRWSTIPISPDQAPLPLPDSASLPPAHGLSSFRRDDDLWYVVYQGVNPGVFSTSLECSLNTLGVACASHDSAPSYDEARRNFRRALGRGEVCVRRTRAV
ncbi:hypothetical protein DFH06DRAFT_1343930 [Mycena polygramma]|nr:hypothetical protein DFH06DRAFT_1343930 [Mycena polygramma]